MSFNSFAGIVRVVTDVETKQVGKQDLVKCRVVHKYSYKDDADVFMGLNFWGNKGAAAEKIVKKGDTLFVKGNLQFNVVNDKTYIDLSVDDFSKVYNNSSDKTTKADKPVKKGKSVEKVEVAVDEEIPF